MSYPRTIRNYNFFDDGTSYFGRASSCKLPGLKIKGFAHRGAGMDGPKQVDIGMEQMTSEVSFAEWAPSLITSFGRNRRWTARPAAMGHDDFIADAYVFTLGGDIHGVEPDELKGGTEAMLKVTMEVDYFKVVFNGDQLFEIDTERGIRKIGDEDQLASLRAAMGA